MSVTYASPAIDPALWSEAFSPKQIVIDPLEQARFLQDFSWYSPILTAELAEVVADVILLPSSDEQLEFAISMAVRFNRPITIRGAGTGNYGQAVPLHGGVLVDMRNFEGVTSVTSSAITVRAGTRIVDAEMAARAQGHELKLMPTSYRKSHVAGFIGGGQAGIGSPMYGRLWDNNILGIDVLSVEDPPRRLSVGPEDLDALIHSYGTVAVMTHVTLPIVPARKWYEMAAVFSDYEAAVRFGWDLAAKDDLAKRLLTMQLDPLPASFAPVKHLYPEGSSIVVLMVDEAQRSEVDALVAANGGSSLPWPRQPEISQFAFAHTMLWAKHHDPSVSWIQFDMACANRDDHLEILRSIRSHFGDQMLLSSGVLHRPGSGPHAGGMGLLRDATPDNLRQAMSDLRDLGVKVSDPHSYLVDDGRGMDHLSKMVAWKHRLDPHGLLNPGKLRAAEAAA